MRSITLSQAVNEAIAEEMRLDETIFLLGEDVAEAGTPFKILSGLVEEFGTNRIIDTPISEPGFTGIAVGAAMTGSRPIVDLMFGDLELSSGSTRIEKRDELAQRMSNKGMKTDSFEYHLNAFDYGVPPHAGCGIGLERLIMALTGTENIRDTTFYPRDVDRLTP